jgi:FtsH-binding integral membrane protein
MEGLSGAVWDREGASHEMNKNLFALLVCGWTCLGLLSSAIMAYECLDWRPSSPWLFIVVLLIPFAGVFITLRSENPVISLLGFALITIPMGAVLGPVLVMYTTASIIKVVAVTMSMAMVLGLIGAMIPNSLESWGSWLIGGLWVLIICSFFEPIARMLSLPVEGALTWIDWAAVVLFSGLLIFDFNRAMRVERTFGNSVDCAVGVYLDIMNLFLHLLRLMGRAKE